MMNPLEGTFVPSRDRFRYARVRCNLPALVGSLPPCLRFTYSHQPSSKVMSATYHANRVSVIIPTHIHTPRMLVKKATVQAHQQAGGEMV